MKNWKIGIGLISITIIISLHLYSKNNILQKELSSKSEELKNLNRRFDIQVHYSSYFKFEPNLKLRKADIDSSKEVFLKNQITSNTFVLFFDKFNCESCIDTSIKMINTKLTSGFKTIIFTTGFNLREINNLRSNKKLSFEVYQLNKLPRFIEKVKNAGFPFYFLINANLEASNIFFPEKESNLEDKYFSKINKIMGNLR